MNKIEPSFIFERIDQGMAILSDGSESIKINKKFMPKNIKPGEKIVLNIMGEQEYEQCNEKRAKEILNEILGSGKTSI